MVAVLCQGKGLPSGVVFASCRVVAASLAGFIAAMAALENSISSESCAECWTGVEGKSRKELALDAIILVISSSRDLILSKMPCKWVWVTWIVVSWPSSDARAAISLGGGA